jgi:DNA replication factor GINS
MNIRNIRAALQSERKQSELQNLDDDFYERVGELLNELYEQRSELVEQTDDPFADAEIQEVNDEIETIQDTVESLYQRRSGKIVKKASFTAAGINEGIDGVTTEEEEIFNSLVTELKNGQDKIYN